jgi:hypothetical protein
MVTKTIHPKDPQAKSPPALKAIDQEKADLESLGTWDYQHPYEAENAAKLYPNCHFARLFAIVGIKNYEQAVEHHKWKGRIVVSGDKIRTATGEWAIFQELGAVPSTMTACRAILAIFALYDGLTLLQSDCVRAYVQAELRGTPTFVRLPRAWWPKEWHSFKDPVCRLVKALYGHPEAGNHWHHHIENELLALQFNTIEGWPSVYVKSFENNRRVIFVLYVDDLVMLGPPELKPLIVTLRQKIKMEEPSDLYKYLGCFHYFAEEQLNGARIMTVQFSMADFFRSACEIFMEETGERLRGAPTPYAPDIRQEDLDALMSKPGKYASRAASYIMKIMYGARMAMPQICVAVSRLSSQISRWTADSDRKLLRVYNYLYSNTDKVLTGSLSTEDSGVIRLIAWPDADLNGDPSSSRSTDGFFVELAGGAGRGMPLAWGSHKQGSTALHTAEAETVSMAHCVRQELLPLQLLMEAMLGFPVECEVMEDNSACIVAITKGYSPSMRHLRRTQRISLGHLHDVFFEKEELRGDHGKVNLKKANTIEHKGDMMTKELAPAQFNRALELIRVVCRIVQVQRQSVVAAVAKAPPARQPPQLSAWDE